VPRARPFQFGQQWAQTLFVKAQHIVDSLKAQHIVDTGCEESALTRAEAPLRLHTSH